MALWDYDNEGATCGPLFAPPVKRRPPKRQGSSGTARWRKLNRHTPAWAVMADIRRVYKQMRTLTRETGRQWSVDHIVPLDGVNVCGLHVAHNLQVIPLEENVAKANNWWPDSWVEQKELL